MKTILIDAWNMFEDGKTHVSLNLKDVKPELYKKKFLKKDCFLLQSIEFMFNITSVKKILKSIYF